MTLTRSLAGAALLTAVLIVAAGCGSATEPVEGPDVPPVPDPDPDPIPSPRVVTDADLPSASETALFYVPLPEARERFLAEQPGTEPAVLRAWFPNRAAALCFWFVDWGVIELDPETAPVGGRLETFGGDYCVPLWDEYDLTAEK